MKPLIAIFLIACSPLFNWAHAQNNEKTSVCPDSTEVSHLHLQGQWSAQLQGNDAPVVLQLGPHPELAHSVRGSAQHAAYNALVSGDVDDGGLTLEESINGTTISATWIGQVTQGSCGKEIRGLWNNVTPPTSMPFILRKQAGWQ